MDKLIAKARKISLPDDGEIIEDIEYDENNLFLFFPNKLFEDMLLPVEKRKTFDISISDIERQSMRFEDFKHCNDFTYMADITIDTSINRKTLIRFEPTNTLWNDGGNWIYIFTLNGFIVKIGGTKNGLKSRAASYLCGHQTRNKNECSTTNGLIYNSFLSYLIKGAKIRMYGMRCPPVVVSIEVFGENHTMETQVFDMYESVLIRKYSEIHGSSPLFSKSCDPRGN